MAAREPRASRAGQLLPDEWRPSEESITWALENVPELAGPVGRRETAKFLDYWHSATGSRARRRDWDAAWRLWMRKAAEDVARCGPAPLPRGQSEAIARLEARVTMLEQLLLGHPPASEEHP